MPSEQKESPVYIIAEAGVNHNGDLDNALRLVEVAADAGADAVKFQTFSADALAVKTAPKAGYQVQTTGASEGQHTMLRALELEPDHHRILKEKAKACGVEFLSTPFDMASLRFLCDDLGLSTLKVPSGEIISGPLVYEAAKSAERLIISTGMATLDDVAACLGVVVMAQKGKDPARDKPTPSELTRLGYEEARTLRNVTLLQCTTQYPAPFLELNLRAMVTLRERFGLPSGFSDHSLGITAPIAAAALGATLVEKHFTLDRKMPGPDHSASLEPAELKAMVRAIRDVTAALGTGVKAPTASEMGNALVVRKAIVAAEPIKKGEPFTERNMTLKRPAKGRSPMEYWHMLGQSAPRDYAVDEPL